MVTVNVVVLAGTVAADPVQRRMPSGDEVAHVFCGCHEGPSDATHACRDLRTSV
jgi:single-stranded DNA-binding protein